MSSTHEAFQNEQGVTNPEFQSDGVTVVTVLIETIMAPRTTRTYDVCNDSTLNVAQR